MPKNPLLVITLGLAALASSHAMAVTGGGDSIPADLYKGSADSILPSNFSYVVAGSSAGKAAFLSNNSTLLSETGTVHFAGSSSVLSSAELGAYNNNFLVAHGPLIQIPSVVTSVTIPYKKAGNTTLNLTSQQLCDAFSGAKTTWGQLLGTSDATAIRIVYRNVSSGTSELLTRHLNAICPSQFGVSSTFTSARLAGGTLPSNWVGVTTDDYVRSAVNAFDGSIGYAGPDGSVVTDNAQVAKINGQLPTPLNVAAASRTISIPSNTDKSDPSKWVLVFANPSAGYPIIGSSNFIFGQCYKDASVAADIRAFITQHWGTTATNLAAVNHNFLPLVQAGWKKAIYETFVTNAQGLNLDINNPSVCNGIGRPL